MFPVIIRQSSLGVSMCPMLAWEREGKGLELQAENGQQLLLLGPSLDQGLGHDHQRVEWEWGGGSHGSHLFFSPSQEWTC